MTIDQTPSQLLNLFKDLRSESAEQFGQGVYICTGWVDKGTAEELLVGVNMDSQSKQLVGLLMQEGRVLRGVVIPRDVGRTEDNRSIDWHARFTYIVDALKAAGYGADTT